MRYNAENNVLCYQLDRNCDSSNTTTQLTDITRSYLLIDAISNNVLIIFLRFYAKSLVRNAVLLVREAISLVREDISLVREAISLVREIISLVREDISLVREDISLVREIISLVREDISLVREIISLVHKIASLRNYWADFMKYYSQLCIYIQSLNGYFQTILLRFYRYSYCKNLHFNSEIYLIMVHKPIHPHPLRHLWQGNDADQLSKRWDRNCRL